MKTAERKAYESEATRLIATMPSASVLQLTTTPECYVNDPAALRNVLATEWITELDDDTLRRFVEGQPQYQAYRRGRWVTTFDWHTIAVA